MLRQSLTLLLLVPLAVVGLKCYDYMRSSGFNNNNIQKTSLQCPLDATFCMKSFVENRDVNGFATFVENRNCANFNVCQQEGCFGSSPFDQVCCCKSDYCNGVSERSGMMAVLAPIAVYALNRFA